MTVERLELTVYFGERARADGGFLADAIAAIFARHELHLSVVLRGMAGFGAAQRLRTDRLLSLSEDLPVVTVAVDARDRIEAALRDIEALGSTPSPRRSATSRRRASTPSSPCTRGAASTAASWPRCTGTASRARRPCWASTARSAASAAAHASSATTATSR